MARRTVMAKVLAVSMLAHGIAVFPETIRYPIGQAMKLSSVMAAGYREYQARRERDLLIQRARDDITKGRFKLGEFILNANRIDAWERGEEVDGKKASARYDRYLNEIRQASLQGKGTREAVSDSLSDLKYQGIEGGTVTELLIIGIGSCTQVAPLIAGLVYDSGHTENAFLRVYKADETGYGHLAPILREDGIEFDLSSGKRSDRKGTLVHAEYLVEAYAKAHDFSIEGSGGEATVAGRHSGFVFPASEDSYEGASSPLFAREAVGQTDRDRANQNESAKKTGDAVERLALERFVSPRNSPGSEFVDVQMDEAPTEQELESISMIIDHLKRKVAGITIPDKGHARVVRGWEMLREQGKLSGLYRLAGYEFRLAGMHRLADAAYKRMWAVRSAAAPLAKEMRSSGEMAGDPWEVVYLGAEGEKLLLRHMRRAVESLDSSPRIKSMAFLIANDSTRKQALGIMKKMKTKDQAKVLEKLLDAGVRWADVTYGPYEALLGITRPKEKEHNVTMKSGQSINIGRYLFRLEKIESINGMLKSTVSVADKGDAILARLVLTYGMEVTAAISGSPTSVDNKAAEATIKCLGISDKEAKFRIKLSDFHEMFEQVKKTSHGLAQKYQLNGGWGEVLTILCVSRSYENNQPGPNFEALFRSWLSEPAAEGSRTREEEYADILPWGSVQ